MARSADSVAIRNRIARARHWFGDRTLPATTRAAPATVARAVVQPSCEEVPLWQM